MEKHHNQLWYTPQEALGLLEPRYLAATKELIADKLKDGLIVAHAAQVWDSFDGSLDDAWRNREEAQADEDADLRCDVIVETWIWRRSRHWQSDLANWRWPERRFVITCRMRGSPERTFLEDVAFRKNDIDRLTQPPSKRGGRKTHHTRWAELFHEVLLLERAGTLNAETFKDKAALERHLLHHFALSEIDRHDDDTIRLASHAIWDRVLGTSI